MIFSRPY